ncbi:MAG TPA: ATP-dependent DNA helicase, partial [Candidatus Nanopelagicales bacterium]|nr:ATP-dependent DNA helicase [Candidatus Nanopelagicales bacterium]
MADPVDADAVADVDDAAGEDGPTGLRTALAAAVAAVDGQDRDGQWQMAQAVAATLAGGDHLLVQAGTGTGKSLAYLVPAMLHATSPERRVVVATATLALQHQLVARDLPRVADALEPVLGRRPTYAVLKGRHNYICLDRVHRGSADGEDSEQAALFAAPRTALGKQSKELRGWVEQTETGDRDDVPFAIDGRVWRAMSVSGRECIGASKCPYGQECFAEAARDRARAAQVVVTNHAMLAIHSIENVPVLPEHDAVVVDEGHELADRATQAVTTELSAPAVERALARSRRYVGEETVDRLEDAAALLGAELTGFAESGGGRLTAVAGSLELALRSVRDACHRAITDMGNGQNRDRAKADPEVGAAQQRAKGLLGEVHDVAAALLDLDEEGVAWVDGGDRRAPTLRLAPLSVAGVLRSALFDKTRMVLTSATLTLGGSFVPVAGSCGLPAEQHGWTGLDVGSPFDHARQGILYVPR